jgi:hypothetical protein
MGNAGDVFTPEGWYMGVSSRAGCYRKSSTGKTRPMPFDLDLAELRAPRSRGKPPAFGLHSWPAPFLVWMESYSSCQWLADLQDRLQSGEFERNLFPKDGGCEHAALPHIGGSECA